MDSFIVKVKNLQDVDTNFDISLSIGKEVLNLYDNGEFAKVCIVYTSFINNLKQEAKIIQVLPFDKSIFELQIVKENQNNTTDLPIEFEPDQKSVIDGLTPQFMQIMLYGCMIESKISEYASRKNAMETATNNANDLYDKYLLNYNQIRQSSITLEINEIIQGSDLTNKG